jgi:hypothetical protein
MSFFEATANRCGFTWPVVIAGVGGSSGESHLPAGPKASRADVNALDSTVGYVFSTLSTLRDEWGIIQCI